jgi:hypothetical protein
MKEPYYVELKGGPMDGYVIAYPELKEEVVFPLSHCSPGTPQSPPAASFYVYRNTGKWRHGRRIFDFIERRD